ncbi:MAG TPA: hypothetical protein DCM54_13350 [Gammaproteobacteria bacterium]|nr:hypothetical protein [Gammaproteobacteria bacterium]
MSETDHGLPIGAVTRMIGVSSHTLRKWESRYDLVTPKRTSSGRRLYSQTDIDKLLLVRELTALGHQVNQLARLSNAELETLLARANATDAVPAPSRALVVGYVIATVARLGRSQFTVELDIKSTDATAWLDAEPQTEEWDAIVLEIPTLGSEMTSRLCEFAANCRLVIVYGFAQSRHLRKLRSRGVACLRAPVDAEELRRTIETQSPPPLNTEMPVPSRRLSDAVIARASGLLPAIQCECPHHIAALLYDLIAFERYSHDCATEQPGDTELHRYLGNIAGFARASFEDALERVATEEGISLE